jgi:predicted nucleic acid-binding protein
MKKIFVDTWYWATLIIGTEQYHQQATDYFRKHTYLGTEFYTSGSVIAETISLILHSKHLIKAPEKRLRPEYAQRFFERFKGVVNQPSEQLKILIANQIQIGKALDLLQTRFRDIPKLGYVDCETTVICADSGITNVLSGDVHYEDLGLPIDEEWKELLEQSRPK